MQDRRPSPWPGISDEVPCASSACFGYTPAFWNISSIFRRADIPQARILRLQRLERSSAGSPQPSSCGAYGSAHIQISSDLRQPIIASAEIDGARVELAPDGSARLAVLVKRRNGRLAALCLLIVTLLPLDAFAQIRESLLPYAVSPRAPQEQPSAFAPLGLRVGGFFWFPHAELDQAYNSNVLATTTGQTGAFITALTSGFDLLSNFPRNSLNLHTGSLSQVYAGHAAQNTQDGYVSADGTLDVTAGSSLYGTAQVARQHISYGSPNSPGSIAQPVTYWVYTATAGYYQGGRRFSYGVDLGTTSAQYNAALLVGGGVLPQSSQDGTASSAAVYASYEIIPDYLGYIRVGGTLFDYWHTVPGETRPNFSTRRIDLGLQILPRNHIIYGEAYAGYLVQNFAQSSLGSSSTPDFGGRLTWSITPLTTLDFSGLLTFNTGTPGTSIPLAGNSYLSKVFTASVSHQLLPNLQLGLTGTYINNTFQGISRADNVFFVTANVRYQVNRNLYLGGDVYYLQQISARGGGPAYSQNIFTLRAGTQF
jgi:hypothetical protein